MNAHSIRHPWFSPTIPKRKHERELDAESEWPSAYRALSGPDLAPRPAKRLKALEGGLAGLTLHTDPAYLQSNSHATVLPTPAIEIQVEKTNQIHDAPLDGDAEPYLASIYEWASPHTGASSVMSLPLQGVVSEVNTSDEDEAPMDEDQKRMGDGVFVEGQGVPDYTFYEPEPNTKKRTWYEPEKDRIVVLDLDSSEDESVTRSPRRRRSAFSLSSSSGQTTSRPRSQTDAPVPEFIINSTLLSHIPPPGAVSIPREEDPAKAVVLFRPVKWGAGQEGESPTEEAPVIEEVKPMDASQDDDDAMDIDS